MHSARVPGPVAEAAAGQVPEGLMGGPEGALAAGLGEGDRAGQGAGLVQKDLEVVVQHQVLLAPVHGAVVAGNHPAATRDLELTGPEAHLDPAPGKGAPAPSRATGARTTRALVSTTGCRIVAMS